MRQIEEFSNSYSQLSALCMMWTAALIGWVWISVLLHMKDFDMGLIYTVVAAVIGVQIYRSIMRLCKEEQRTVRMYKNYLDTFSYQVLYRMHNDPGMSPWSRKEMKKYLAAAMSWGY